MADLELDLATTALILVDFTNGLLSVDMGPHSADDVVANASRLADAFRAKEAFVVLTSGAPPVPLSKLSQSVAPAPAVFERDISALMKAASAPDAGSIVAAVGPKPGDHHIRKLVWSAFLGTDLDFQLRRRSVRTVVVGGIATNFGAESTGRDARGLGYSVVFVEDAMRALTKDEHEHSCTYTMPMTGRVRSTADVVSAVEAHG